MTRNEYRKAVLKHIVRFAAKCEENNIPYLWGYAIPKPSLAVLHSIDNYTSHDVNWFLNNLEIKFSSFYDNLEADRNKLRRERGLLLNCLKEKKCFAIWKYNVIKIKCRTFPEIDAFPHEYTPAERKWMKMRIKEIDREINKMDDNYFDNEKWLKEI